MKYKIRRCVNFVIREIRDFLICQFYILKIQIFNFSTTIFRGNKPLCEISLDNIIIEFH